MISDNLHKIRASLPEGVTLVAVSKFHPVERLREAYDAGQRVFAESRPQELAAKVLLMPSDVQWHFIGHLQTNKLKLVLPYVSLVQSVDSLHLLDAIERWGEANDRTVDVLLEVHIASDAAKQGFAPEELPEAIASYSHIRLRGLMGMATLTEDEAVIEGDFARMEALYRQIRAARPELTAFDQLSIGMSGDWPIAVRHAATMVRIGTDIFGPREY